jgi:hypothetical protein
MSEDYEILPTVLVIHPSGYTEFLDTDMSSMTSSEIESLIYGEDLEVAHSSEHLERITNECGLEKNLVMYFVKKAVTEDLEDNYVGSMLYDGGAEVRGPIIIALEDNEQNISSFENEEDIENVFDAIDELTGILRRETDDDGRYDPWS